MAMVGMAHRGRTRVVNKHHPLAQGLELCLHFWENPLPINRAPTGSYYRAIKGGSTATPGTRVTPDGLAMASASASNIQVVDPGLWLTGVNAGPGPGFTVAFDFQPISTDLSAIKGVMYKGDGGAHGTGSWAIFSGATANALEFDVYNTGFLGSCISAATLVAGGFYRCAAVVTTIASGSCQWWINGATSGSAGSFSGTITGNSTNLEIGSYFSAGNPMGGAIGRVLFWCRALRASELAMLTKTDPYAYLMRARTDQWVDTDVAGPATPSKWDGAFCLMGLQ